jgi:hypothetical protein
MSDSWAQILTVVIANIGAIWWFRKESREDWIRCQNTIDAIQKEMKDFHERLLQIEMDKK